MEKRERGREAISSSLKLRLLGRISSGELDENFGEENGDLINRRREEYQVAGNFIQPCSDIVLLGPLGGHSAGPGEDCSFFLPGI